MAISISQAYIDTFESNVRYLAQQFETKLRGTVMERATNGSDHNWDRLGVLDAADKTAARTATPEQDAEWSRRVSQAGTKHIGTSTEQEDPIQMLIDPNSSLVQAVGAGMRRGLDDVVIAAATADAQTGTGTPEAFPAGQIIGDGTTEISFDFVTQIQQKFMENDIDPSVPKVAVVGPAQVRKLMQLTQQTSADYVNREALQQLNASGIVPNWLGFTWIMSTRLLTPIAGQRQCLFYTDKALGLQMNRDITTRVQEDPSISFAWRIYAYMTLGAVRVEDEQIVQGYFAD